MPLYDLMLLLDPTAPSDRHEAIMREVQGILESSGSIRGDYDWGTRRMAFEIDHRPEAAYHLVQFETAPGGELLERIDHSLKIMDGVLRHRIIRLKDGAPPPPAPRPEGRRDYDAAAPVEAAVGAPAESTGAADGAPAPAADTAPAPAADTAPAQPAEAPASAEQPAAPADAPAPAEERDAGPAGDGGDDEAPSGPAAG